MKATLPTFLALVGLVTTAGCGKQGTLAELEAQQAAAAVTVDGTGKIDPKTSKITVALAGAATPLPYALYTVSGNASSPAKQYVLTASTYNVCGWGAEHGWAGHPNLSSIVAMYLLNETNGTIQAPVAGTYQVTQPPQGATGLFIDPTTSGYGSFATACTGNWPGLASGSVTIANIDGTGVVTGSLDLTLNDGSLLQGEFTTANCTGREVTGTTGTATDCTW